MDSRDPKSELVERSKKASKRSTKSVLMNVCVLCDFFYLGNTVKI